jgi:hypothetical protein
MPGSAAHFVLNLWRVGKPLALADSGSKGATSPLVSFQASALLIGGKLELHSGLDPSHLCGNAMKLFSEFVDILLTALDVISHLLPLVRAEIAIFFLKVAPQFTVGHKVELPMSAVLGTQTCVELFFRGGFKLMRIATPQNPVNGASLLQTNQRQTPALVRPKILSVSS